MLTDIPPKVANGVVFATDTTVPSVVNSDVVDTRVVSGLTSLIVGFILVIIFSFTVIFFLEPSYGTDTLRYVFAGKQLIEHFFLNPFSPLIKKQYYSEKIFNKGVDY